MAEPTAEQFWEDFYRERDRVWSGKVNPLFAREVDALSPGTALDLGCGEGADAIWLAERGWQVTATDISATALERAAQHAADADVADQITFVRHNLLESFPEATFDLVSAQFLHSPVAAPGERDSIMFRAAEAVAPGGVLLIVGHAGWPTWVTDQPAFEFPTIDGTLALLDPYGPWSVETSDLVEREIVGPEGQPGTRADTVLRLRRPAAVPGR